MSSPNDSIDVDSLPLLADHLRHGRKGVAHRKCGLEMELFGFRQLSLERIDALEVQAVLASFAKEQDRRYYEKATLIELCVENLGHVTIEPGGQIEFSGRARSSLIEMASDLSIFLTRLKEVADQRKLIFLAAGFDPLRGIAEQRWFPKMRYDVMRPHLASRGLRGWDMMTRTCAIQVSLDFDSESDWSKKFLLGNRLAPIITAIFANSPFAEGKLSGYKSTRAATWLQTDVARCGLSPVALEDSVSFEDYVDYTLRVPMIFIRRNGHYRNAPNELSFGQFLTADAGAYLKPIFQDWTDHLTTIFTDARVKQYIELRSADCGSAKYAMALAALWKGLFYDAETLDQALQLAPRLDASSAASLREQVARHGLAARHENVEVLSLAKDVIELAAIGLRRIGAQELHYLDILRETVIDNGVSPADILLGNWHGSWHGSMAQVFDYMQAS